jgi:phosphate transport system substrate-binding protein
MRALLLLLAVQSAFAQDAVVGAGATFPAPLYQKWIAAFESKNPGAAITYEATGSSIGVDRFLRGQLDFAASDILPDQAKLGNAQALPSVVGAVVPVYNLPGLKQDLRFSSEVLAGIFLGKISKWNDPKIKILNRGLDLPDAAIKVVHRSDGSGTTFVFSDFLSKTDADWKSSMGAASTLNWPAGEAASGNEGVAKRVTATEFSIGYVEFIYAVQQHLSFGGVRNSEGKFVRADIDSITAAAKTTPANGNFLLSITNAPGRDAYPIASFTWLLISPTTPPAGPKRDRLMSFLAWALTTGQRQAAALGYVPLPDDLAQRERNLLSVH